MSMSMNSIRSLCLINYTISLQGFLQTLNDMPHLEEVILIDATLCESSGRDINDTGPWQRSMWLRFARSFETSNNHEFQKRLLIGVTEGSVCQGSDVDYSVFNNVRKLSEDEVLDVMNRVDFER